MTRATRTGNSAYKINPRPTEKPKNRPITCGRCGAEFGTIPQRHMTLEFIAAGWEIDFNSRPFANVCPACKE